MVVNDLTGSGRNHEEAGAVGYVVPDQPARPVMRAPDQRPHPEGVRPRPLGWVIFALALGGFGIGTTEFVSMGLLPTIAGALGVTEPTAGHLVSMYALGVVVGAPVIAALTARMSRRTLLIVLMAAFTLGNLTTVLAPSYPLLLAARFVAGLPHGAYFGVAAIVAAHLAGPRNRAKAVGMTMLGLSVANVAGVPLATWLGDTFGWRAAYVVVVAVGVLTLLALLRTLPPLTDMRVTNPLTELGALRRSQVWFTLFIGIVGNGGLFAFYTYLNSTLTSLTGVGSGAVPWALMLFGLGMVAGNIVGGAVADRNVTAGIAGGLGAMVAVLIAFAVCAQVAWAAFALTFLVGMAGASMIPALQTRLMDVADDAQTLAASMNHSALNVANAIGAWIGGVVVAAGLGYRAPSLFGAGLAAGGLLILVLAVVARRGAPATTVAVRT
ncbi:DHA1 family inner membrane transport protein [Gordonia amarae]|nr:MFS transporter [Gordonia amarae]MCS3878288.1 DHA1 family inner membrane transport protein [Gordonia amarae]GAB06528.1 putative major facilitator superfamily transporter [Gordonia amarae NBRC 15530]